MHCAIGANSVPERSEAVAYSFKHWEIDLARRELRANGRSVPLGGRAFEILEVLARTAGAMVSKDELMARIWPGAAVEENTLQVHISAVRKALAADRDLLKTVSGRGYRLLGDWQVQSDRNAKVAVSAAKVASAGAAVQSNLPLPISDLVGREGAIRHLRDLVTAHRLVTLTGPGGIGKTSLALAAARELLPVLRGDGWLVELAMLSDPSLVCSTVAGVLGLTLTAAGTSAATIASAIGDRPGLLVLDNCEHVIDAAACLAETLLRLCQGVTILATSQEMLGIDGEVNYRVPPLDVAPDDPAEPLRTSAEQLFIRRWKSLHFDSAGQFDSPGQLDSASRQAISAICRTLDGLPLAIELAAARAEVLGVRQVITLLQDRFGLLTGGRRTALPRHKTLRATLDWSYDLLTAPEQRLLRRLATFTSGFSIDAAAAVSGDSDAALLDGLASLVAKSLLNLERSTGPTRWRLLETTRTYVLEKLEASGEADETRRRHAGYYHDFLRHAYAEPPTMSQTAMSQVGRAAFHAEHLGNVVAALEWSFSASGDVGIGTALAAVAAPLLLDMSLLAQCQHWTQLAVAALDPTTRGTRREMELQASMGLSLMYSAGARQQARAAIARALELADKFDDPYLQLRLLHVQHLFLSAAADLRKAVAIARRAEEIAQRSADPAASAIAHAMLAIAYDLMGNEGEAARAHQVALSWRSAAGRVNVAHFGHNMHLLAQASLARSLWLRGYPDQAVHAAVQAIESAEAFGHGVTLCLCLVWTISVFRWIGDWERAAESIDKLLNHIEKHSLTGFRAVGNGWKGGLLIRDGRAAEAAQAIREAVKSLQAGQQTFLVAIFHGYLAEAVAMTDTPAEALPAIAAVEAQAEISGGLFNVPELLRIKGAVLAALPGSDPAEAEACLLRSIDLAREQSAMSWELRAATSLARFWIDRGRTEEARTLLAAVYDRFTEGFETADLRGAREVLALAGRRQAAGAVVR